MAFLDRVIRRRLVLGLLVATSLALLTGYFREANAGPLHDAQERVADAASPAEGAVQRVAQPFRDAWGWTRGLVDARAERDRLRRDNAALTTQVALLLSARQQGAELRELLKFVQDPKFQPMLSGYVTKGADVVRRAPGMYNSRVRINAGSVQGVQEGDPVVTGPGYLVGVISSVSARSSEVSLINDPSISVTAEIPGANAKGSTKPSLGDPNALSLDYVRKYRNVKQNQYVTTAGGGGPQLRSGYPRGLLIGQVSNIGQSASDAYKQIQVTPFADLSSFSSVLVLIPKIRRGGK